MTDAMQAWWCFGVTCFWDHVLQRQVSSAPGPLRKEVQHVQSVAQQINETKPHLHCAPELWRIQAGVGSDLALTGVNNPAGEGQEPNSDLEHVSTRTHARTHMHEKQRT